MLTLIKAYDNGGGEYEVNGITIRVGATGEVSSMSAWHRVDELVATGILRKKSWKGNGMYGHDTFSLNR